MKEEGMSSSCDPILPHKSSSSPPPPTPTSTPTPAASSAGASSPAFPTNVGSTDGLGQGQGHGQGQGQGQSSRGGSLWSQPTWISGGSILGSSQPSCRPWERGDLLRRLSTFTPLNWFGKPKAVSSLACARRGWVNVSADKIECESCTTNLVFITSSLWTPSEANTAGEEFYKKLDEGHKGNCPWRGNTCAESLVQFPPTPPVALIGGFKDRYDGLLQFVSLPVIAASALEQIRASRGAEIDRFLAQSHAGESGFRLEMGADNNVREDVFLIYSRAQKLISLCGWEPRWMRNIQDCEEHSAQSARNGCSVGPTKYRAPPKDPSRGKNALSVTKKIKNKTQGHNFKGESRLPLLDCSLCGATVKIWDFVTVSRPASLAPNSIDIPEINKKMTRGVSAASGISGRDKEQIEDLETDQGLDLNLNLNLTMASGLSAINRGKGIVIGHPSSSEVGDRATSYESRGPTGPSSRKRNIDEGGSTGPQIMTHQADSVEGTVIDRDNDEVNDYSAGPSKRARDNEGVESHILSYRMNSYLAGPSEPSHSFNFETGVNDYFEQVPGVRSTRDSTRVSSVVAMDTLAHSAGDDSMESVENHPGDMEDIQFPSTSTYRYNNDLNENSEINGSIQAQQSACIVMNVSENVGEMGLSSTNDEEVLNMDNTNTNTNTNTVTAHVRDHGGPSFGSVGMGASHEAEIHGSASFIRGDIEGEPIAEITENQGQTGEFADPDPGLMGDYVPEEMDSQSVGKAEVGSASAKAESVESGEKTAQHPSLSCNAVISSGYEASKEEVTQAEKVLPNDDNGYVESKYLVANNSSGNLNGESNYEEAVEFDPIKYHNSYCPWVNGNVAAAGCSSGGSSSSSSGGTHLALCGWQLTLDALDASQSLGHVAAQNVESESAASLYKDDHLIGGQKLLTHHSFSKSRGQS